MKKAQLFDDWKEEICSSSRRPTMKTTMSLSGSGIDISQGEVGEWGRRGGAEDTKKAGGSSAIGYIVEVSYHEAAG
ncbi:hypothetical protein Dimus_029948 [Dionaea muscipula]